jgi:uncharacterized protein YodC (DUF2158 family)
MGTTTHLERGSTMFQIHDVVTLSETGERIVHKTAGQYGSGYVVEVAEWDGPPCSATVYRVVWYSPRTFQRTIFREAELRTIRRDEWDDEPPTAANGLIPRVPERNPLLDVAAYGPVPDSHSDAYQDRDFSDYDAIRDERGEG